MDLEDIAKSLDTVTELTRERERHRMALEKLRREVGQKGNAEEDDVDFE